MTTKEITSNTVDFGIKNWKQTATPDEILDAYAAGKVAGKKELQDLVIKKFHDNLKLACDLSERVYDNIREVTGKKSEVRIKADSLIHFESIFIIDEKSYSSSDTRKKLHDFILSIRREMKKDELNVDFVIISDGKKINEDILTNHGFFLKYLPHGKRSIN
jgi:hypothetical protein